MATDFIMPRPPTTSSRDPFFQQPTFQAPYQYNAAADAQVQAQAQAQIQAAAASNFVSQYNPQISPLSTSNSSPTSPKSCYHTRQVRPLYIPAVLRPTEHPSRELPTKSKARKGGDKGDANGSAIDDGDATADDEDDQAAGRSSGSFISLPGLGAFGIGRLTRRSTNDSGKCVDASWNLDLFPEVNGLPSREHWKPDPESSMCDEPTCKRYFNYFNRRHHCRRCGNIFCDMHSAYEIPLDENANYNPRGSSSRACSFCFREFKAWRTRNNSSDLSNGSTTPNGAKVPSTAPVSPVMALSRGVPGAPGTPTVAKTPDVAQSVPGDWNWSTF